MHPAPTTAFPTRSKEKRSYDPRPRNDISRLGANDMVLCDETIRIRMRSYRNSFIDHMRRERKWNESVSNIHNKKCSTSVHNLAIIASSHYLLSRPSRGLSIFASSAFPCLPQPSNLCPSKLPQRSCPLPATNIVFRMKFTHMLITANFSSMANFQIDGNCSSHPC